MISEGKEAMKNIKRTIFSLLLFLSFIFLIGCDGSGSFDPEFKLEVDRTTLNVGEQLTIEAKIVVGSTLVDVPAGLEYKSSNEAVLTVSNNGVVEGVSAGNATVTANVEYEGKALESKLDFEVKVGPQAPTNLTITDGVLTWTAVSGATGYVVEVNGTEHNVTTTNFNLESLNLPVGSYQVKVFTKVGNDLSNASTISYTVSNQALEDAIYAELLKSMNSEYEPDMDEEDFEEEYYYENYLYSSRMARALAKGAVLAGMTLEEAQEFTAVLAEVRDTEPESIAEIKVELDKFRDLDFEPSKLAKILVEVMVEVLDIVVENEYDNIEFRKEELETMRSELEEFKSGDHFTQLMDQIEDYATSAELLLLNQYIDGHDFNFYTDLYDVVSSTYYGFMNEDYEMANWYLNFEEPLITAVINIMFAALDNNDSEFLDEFNFSFYMLENARHQARYNEDYENRIESMERDLVELEGISNLVDANKDSFHTSIEAVLEYVFDLYDNIDGTLIVLLDNLNGFEEVSMDELFILKDELVDLFKTTLPSAAEFEKMYLSFLVLMYDYLAINPSQMTGFSATLGHLEHLSLTLLLNVFEDITQDMVEEVFALVSEMHTPGYWDEDEMQYYPPTTDPRKVVELVVFLGDFYFEIKETYKTTIEALEALSTTTFESQVETIIGSALERLTMDEESNQSVIMAWNLYLENKDTYQAVIEMVKKYGEDVFFEFVETNGKLVLDFITFAENMETADNPTLFAEDFREIFEQLMDYHALTIEEFTNTEIDHLVEFVLINARQSYLLFNNEEMDTEEFNNFLDNINPHVKQLVRTLIELEIELAQALKANDAGYEFLALGDKFEVEESLAIQIFLALNVVLTAENEEKIEDALDVLFDDIFADEFFMEMNQVTAEELAEMRTDVDTQIEEFLTHLSRVAEYDFEDLSQEEYDDFVALMSYLFGQPYDEFEE